jgi:tRNA (adenine37-N6)-methyltransferase
VPDPPPPGASDELDVFDGLAPGEGAGAAVGATDGSITLAPIGVFRGPFTEAAEAPRQPPAAATVPARIELYPRPGFEHALADLEGWEYLWVVFWFDRAGGFRPKVLPPRSSVRRGLFATRSPHRPNPIGLSAVRLLRVEGLTVHIEGVDILDGTPVLDLKPYVPYADAYPQAKTGWLTPDPEGERVPQGERPKDPQPAWAVQFEARADHQLTFLLAHGVDLREAIVRALALGPQPHPYRRIRQEKQGLRLAVKDWRVDFRVGEDRNLIVVQIATGYRPKELYTGRAPAPHEAFVEAFFGADRLTE